LGRLSKERRAQLIGDSWRSRLREALDASGRAYGDIARGAGIDAGTLSALLNQRGPIPSLVTLVRLARELNITIGWLLGEKQLHVGKREREDLRRAARLILDLTAAEEESGLVEVLATPENCAETAVFCRIVGDSMSPVLEPGWLVRIDTTRRPEPGDVTVVSIHGQGRIVGYWSGDAGPMLEKENPAATPVDLTGKSFEIVGVVVAVVSAPLLARRPA
jgi:transcriptional regulator with XRE-family HTH domain